jgi:hypothetical protein
MKALNSFMDKYYSKPLPFDFVIILLFCFVYWLLTSKHKIELVNDAELIKSFTTDLINTSISLAGFVLASLTIIVTFKDNTTSKKINQTAEESQEATGLELLFSSKHYSTIVKTFSTAVFLLLSGFVVLSLYKFFFAKLPLYIGDYLLIISILIIALSVFRCVLLLYKIIKLQIKN